MTKLIHNGKIEIEAYRQRAGRYDSNLKIFKIFSMFGFNILGWRKQAIEKLGLKAGDTVVDIGCGTGLNFPYLYDKVTSSGKIIGVDISEEMLTQAQQTIKKYNWHNIELICSDAVQYTFPSNVNAVISTYALILIPDCKKVVLNASKALAPKGRLVVLDMAWPSYCPVWWRYVLFFLSTYGITEKILRQRPWDSVQNSINEQLQEYSEKRFWFGFFYLSCGKAHK